MMETMQASTYTLMFLAAFLLPILISAAAMLFTTGEMKSLGRTNELRLGPKQSESNPNAAQSELGEYLTTNRSMQDYDYVNSATAYMLQVSTTFYFVFWGYNYGIANILYMLTWAVGLGLFALAAGKLIDVRLHSETVAGFLSNNKFTNLRKLTACISILAYLSMFYVESYFSSDFISILANTDGNTAPGFIWWPVFLSLTLLVVLYSIAGGMRRVVVADRWQISVAFVSLSIVVSFLVSRALANSTLNGLGIAITLLGIFLILFFFNRGEKRLFSVRVSIVVSLSIILLTCIVFYKSPEAAQTRILIPGLLSQLREPWGWFTLLGFTIVNLLWQFCDNTNFQRLASLKLTNGPSAVQKLRVLTLRLVVVSPVTWGIGIVIGIGIRASGIGITQTGSEYITLLVSLKSAALLGDTFALVSVLALCAALTSIMLETLDIALITMCQVYIRDIRNSGTLETKVIFGVGLIAYVLVVLVAIVHKQLDYASILTVMAGAYSGMVIIAIPVIMKLVGIRVGDKAIMIGLVLGFVLTWTATFGPTASLPWNVKLVLPFYAGPLGTIVPILIGAMHRKKEA